MDIFCIFLQDSYRFGNTFDTMLSMLTVNLLGDVATFEGAPLTGKQLAEQNVQGFGKPKR